MTPGNPVWALKLVRETYPKYKISGSSDVYQLAKEFIFPKLVNANVESFYFIGVNNCNEVMIIDEHSRGGVNESRIYIAEIAKKLLLCNCNQVLLIHNHPSGNLVQSPSDMSITEKLREALAFFEIRVLDHLIVGYEVDNFISFKELGLI